MVMVLPLIWQQHRTRTRF